MRQAAKQLYDLFMSLTAQGKYVLPWDELPVAWQDAWVAVFKRAKVIPWPE